MISIPLYGGESKVSDGLWGVDIAPEWSGIVAQLATVGSSLSVGGITAAVEQSTPLEDGGRLLIVRVTGAGANGAGIQFNDLLGGALQGVAVKILGSVVRKVYKVIDNKAVEFAIYLAAVVVAVLVLWGSASLWRRWK